MTNKEYYAQLRAITRYRKQSERELIRDYAGQLRKTGVDTVNNKPFNYLEFKAGLDQIYKDHLYRVDSKIAQVEERYYSDALKKIGAKPVEIATTERPQRVWELIDGRMVSMDSLVTQKSYKAFELSQNIWGDNVKSVQDFVMMSKAEGIDAKDIIKDLEGYLTGSKTKVGKWRSMTLDVQEGWQREYLDSINGNLTANDVGYIMFGSDEANFLLQTDDAKRFIQSGLMSDKTPKSVQRYERRFGEPLDYRAIRVYRTESMRHFNTRMNQQATGFSGTGKVRRVLAQSRDAWKCDCMEAKDWINRGGGKKVEYIPKRFIAPLHPNCECRDEPIFLSNDEVIDKILKEVQ